MINVQLSNRNTELSNNKLRQENIIPGVISFANGASVPVQLPLKKVEQISTLKNDVIKLNGLKLDTKQGMLVNIQRDPVKNNPIHFSLEALQGGASNNEVTRPVRLKVEGTPEWIAPYHTIQTPVDTIHMEGDLRKIPNMLTVDISSLKEGETLHGRDINIPKGLKISEEDLERVVVTVVANNLDLETDTEQASVEVESMTEEETPLEDIKATS